MSLEFLKSNNPLLNINKQTKQMVDKYNFIKLRKASKPLFTEYFPHNAWHFLKNFTIEFLLSNATQSILC